MLQALAIMRQLRCFLQCADAKEDNDSDWLGTHPEIDSKASFPTAEPFSVSGRPFVLDGGGWGEDWLFSSCHSSLSFRLVSGFREASATAHRSRPVIYYSELGLGLVSDFVHVHETL